MCEDLSIPIGDCGGDCPDCGDFPDCPESCPDCPGSCPDCPTCPSCSCGDCEAPSCGCSDIDGVSPCSGDRCEAGRCCECAQNLPCCRVWAAWAQCVTDGPCCRCWRCCCDSDFRASNCHCTGCVWCCFCWTHDGGSGGGGRGDDARRRRQRQRDETGGGDAPMEQPVDSGVAVGDYENDYPHHVHRRQHNDGLPVDGVVVHDNYLPRAPAAQTIR